MRTGPTKRHLFKNVHGRIVTDSQKVGLNPNVSQQWKRLHFEIFLYKTEFSIALDMNKLLLFSITRMNRIDILLGKEITYKRIVLYD